MVWRAWLGEYGVQLSALETEDSAAGKAFEFVQALRKAGRLTGKKGKHGRRIVREVALAAELLRSLSARAYFTMIALSMTSSYEVSTCEICGGRSNFCRECQRCEWRGRGWRCG